MSAPSTRSSFSDVAVCLSSNSWARSKGIHPVPVHRSRTLRALRLVLNRARVWIVSMRYNIAAAVSCLDTINQLWHQARTPRVAHLGINTSGVHFNSMGPNHSDPIMYCIGFPCPRSLQYVCRIGHHSFRVRVPLKLRGLMACSVSHCNSRRADGRSRHGRSRRGRRGFSLAAVWRI